MKKYDYTINLDDHKAPACILRMLGQGKKVLEVGCASGPQTRVMTQQLGCQVTGLEIDPQAAAEAQAYCERVIIGNIENIDLKMHLGDERFDVITLADVLEHLYTPAIVLERVKPYLKPDGCVLASIPNVVHASLVFEMMFGRFNYRDYGILDNTHIRFFTRKTIYQLFESAGYLITQLERIRIPLERTEFATIAVNSEDRQVLDYIARHNPESDTFQFVLRAIPFESLQHTSALINAQERINELERNLHEREQQLRKLESAIQWLERPRLTRFIERISMITRIKKKFTVNNEK